MENLKANMRKMFDEKSHPSSVYYENELEEGLLQKILNFSSCNLLSFDEHAWNIIDVKSSVSKYKLYKYALNNQRVFDAANVLIVLDGENGKKAGLPGFDSTTVNSISSVIKYSSQTPSGESSRLLAMSIMYASKYYGVDFCKVDEFDAEGIKCEFGISSNLHPATLICLGYFEKSYSSAVSGLKSYPVRVIMEI